MRTVGLIPARGGSKRLPRKNILECAGKPLIAWTIEAALGSKLDVVYVSTEDDEIAGISRAWGAKTIRRPVMYASDKATSRHVIEHALNHFDCDRVMLLQPTSPLRTSQHIDECLGIGRTIVSVTDDGLSLHRNGAIYLMDRERLMHFELAYIMPSCESVDIDTQEDFDLAEAYLLARGVSQARNPGGVPENTGLYPTA